MMTGGMLSINLAMVVRSPTEFQERPLSGAENGWQGSRTGLA